MRAFRVRVANCQGLIEMNCMQMLKHLSTNSRSAISENPRVGGVWLWNRQSEEAVRSTLTGAAQSGAQLLQLCATSSPL